ncbi:Gfo/Idh/MocA family protein [Falsihalocynthiibacter sp. SS001]|uniref:Gfo/Idh/MocA family protein n=1 Tax=Falsihalocynthiibacter sp. SS001 TaxID=3349698 RepID=UPI0036D255CE
MIRVLIVGVGNMGQSHALAHHKSETSEIIGIVNRTGRLLAGGLDKYPRFETFEEGLAQNPDLVVIATHSDSHAEFAIRSMELGADVFVEKPLAPTIQEAESVVAAARATRRKLVVGYILRHHPSWMRLIEEARALGGPYVFRMNLNQQSTGAEWEVHKQLMQSTSPLVDCGVHYVDVMCQIAQSKPISVNGIGLRLSDEIPDGMYNYGQLQVTFEDGSVGWYEAGWGPMMSETAVFVKDVISPHGSVSITDADRGASAEIEGHTKVGGILVHRLDGDHFITLPDEPDHQALCDAEQAYVLRVIREGIDLDAHMSDALESLRICIAADESIRKGVPVSLI